MFTMNLNKRLFKKGGLLESSIGKILLWLIVLIVLLGVVLVMKNKLDAGVSGFRFFNFMS